MKKSPLILLLLSLTVLFIFSCSDSTCPDQKIGIEGRVVDANGNPIADARIMLTYNLEDILDRPTTVFSFNVPEDTEVKFWITQHNVADTLIVLLDSELTAGYHSVTWDSKDTNGIMVMSNFYDYHLKIDEETTTRKYLLNQYYHNIGGVAVQGYEPNAITDDSGKFKIDLDNLPFSYSDNELNMCNEDGEFIGIKKVSREVNIWALHENYNYVLIDSVLIYEEFTGINDIVME